MAANTTSKSEPTRKTAVDSYQALDVSAPTQLFRVYEKGEHGHWWNHGSIFTGEEEARADLDRMREFYGKYGREFALKTMTVTPWEFVEEAD